jgi:hypothetical protein
MATFLRDTRLVVDETLAPVTLHGERHQLLAVPPRLRCESIEISPTPPGA